MKAELQVSKRQPRNLKGFKAKISPVRCKNLMTIYKKCLIAGIANKVWQSQQAQLYAFLTDIVYCHNK